MAPSPAASLCVLLATAVAPGARSQSPEDIDHILANHPGCFHKGFQYTPDMKGTNQKATSLQECQLQCRNMPECRVFAYFPFTSDCYFGDWRAYMVESPYGAIAGQAVCPEPTPEPLQLCRTEVPNNGFPGVTGNTTNLAWPGGRQPWSLECWPKNWTGGYIPCQQVTVIQDTTSWPGKCVGLTKQSPLIAGAGADESGRCQQSCMQNPLCAMWQTPPASEGSSAECWQGVGKDCFVRDGFEPTGAQRLQHGEVRKLMDLAGWQIVGLFKSFDNSGRYFVNNNDAINACKAVCYSDIRCQYWTYSPKYGCYVEDPSQGYSPGYPLTLDWAYRSTSFALDCIAGEYIQHFCPDSMTTAYPSAEPEAIASCMKRGVRYDPPDMTNPPDSMLQHRTVEMNAMACQTRCRGVTGCAYFAYWPDGGCHLQDTNAKEVTAEDYRVVSGPGSCDADWTAATAAFAAPAAAPADERTQKAETNWLTAEGEEVLNGNVPGPNIPDSMIEPNLPSPSFPDPLSATQIAEIRVSIGNLDAASLTELERQQLKAQYLNAFSEALSVPSETLQADPAGHAGQVALLSEPPASCGILAYLPKPLGSAEISQMQANLESPSLDDLLKRATLNVLGSSNGAIQGTLEVVSPTVTLRTVQVTTASPLKDVQCDFLCMYWPIILGCIFLTCIGGFLGFMLFRQPPTKKASRRTRALLSSDTEQGQGSTYDPSDFDSRVSDEDGDASVWAEEPAWDDSPVRASPTPPRDNSIGDFYSKTKGETIFEA